MPFAGLIYRRQFAAVAAAVFLLMPGAAAAQEFAYLLQGGQITDCTPSFCEARLAKIDLQSGEFVGTYQTQTDVFASLAQSLDGRYLAMASWRGGIRVLDRVNDTQQVVGDYSTTLLSPPPVAVSSRRNDRFYLLFSDRLDVFDIQGQRVSYPLSSTDRAMQMVVDAAGRRGYIATSGGIIAMNLDDYTIAATLTLPGTAGESIAISADGARLFTVRTAGPFSSATLYGVNTDTLSVFGSQSIPHVGGALLLAVAPAGSTLWVMGSRFVGRGLIGSALRGLQADTLSQIAELNFPRPTKAMALSRDGSKLLTSGDLSAEIIDTATATSLQTISFPWGSFNARSIVVLPEGAPCVYRVSPHRITVPGGGGNFEIAVPSPPGCVWSAQANTLWVQGLTPTLANQSGQVRFTIPAWVNEWPGSTRGARVSVAGEEVAVNQNSCAFTTTPTDARVPAQGGLVSISIATDQGCSWSLGRAQTYRLGGPSDLPPGFSPPVWLRLQSPQSGIGPGVIHLLADSNPSPHSRAMWFAIGNNRTRVLQSEAIAPGAPAAPVGLTAQVNGRFVALSWGAPGEGPDFTQYWIEAGTASGDHDLFIGSVGSVHALSAGPLEGGTYYVRVRAANGAGLGPPSNEASFRINALSPEPVTNVVWTEPARATISWQDALPSLRYRLEVGRSAAASDFAVVEVTGSSLVVPRTALSPGRYWLRVRRVNDFGPRFDSTPLDAVLHIATCDAPPAALQDVSVTQNGSVVTLSLRTSSSQPFDAFRIYVGRSPGASDVGVFDLQTPTVTSALPPGRYYLRAATVNSCGTSALSAEQSFVVP